jgi:hypothetical protein
MGQGLRSRFWLESALGCASATLLLLTALRPDWIEMVFRIDPDQHSGSLEWAIVAALLAATVLCFALARQEWRSMRLRHA